MLLSVLFDHQIFTMQNSGGISRYYYELMKRFAPSSSIDLQFVLNRTSNHYILSDKALCDKFGIELISSNNSMDKVLNSFSSAFFGKTGNRVVDILKHGSPRIFHPSYYGNYYIGNTHNSKVVVTVHDMIHEKFPELFDPSDDTFIQKYRSIKNADHLICVSESTRQDLMSFYGISKNKTTVIPLGSSFENSGDDVRPANVGGRYVLYVGSRDKYKNFQFSIWALAKVFAQATDLKLVIFGGGNLSIQEKFFLQQVLGDRYIAPKDTSDELLKQLYKGASALLFPSYYEGFGIPVLEAFTFGCPVVCSSSSSLPEVGGEAAFYFDGKSVDSLFNAIIKAVKAHGSDEYRHQQRIQLSKFSWDKTATMTAEVYHSLGVD